MIKLIATDLDNTLLAKDGSLPDETAAALRRAQEKGVTVTVATGRTFASARGVAAKISAGGRQNAGREQCAGGDAAQESPQAAAANSALAICYNGSQIRRLSDGAVIAGGAMPAEVQRQIIRFVHERGLYLQMYDRDEIVVERLRLDKHNDPDLQFATHREVGDFLAAPLFETPKMMIAADPAAVPALQAELEERFRGEIFCAQSEPHLIEIMPAAVNKGTALATLQESMGITRAETMACGDNTNDLHLLRAAGLAIAVANAVPALQEYADYVCEGERSDGFCEAVEKFVLAEDAETALAEWQDKVL